MYQEFLKSLLSSPKEPLLLRHNPSHGAFFELTECNRKDYSPSSSDNNLQNSKRNESMSGEVLGTGDLISAIGQLWDSAVRPGSETEKRLNNDYDKRKLNQNCVCYYSTKEWTVNASTSGKDEYFSINVVPTSYHPSIVNANFESLKVAQKISFVEFCTGNHISSLSGRFSQGIPSTQSESFKENGLASVGISYDLKNVYEWMTEIKLCKLKQLVRSTCTNSKHKNGFTSGDMNCPATCSSSIDASNHGMNISIGNTDCSTEVAKPLDSVFGQTSKSCLNKQASSMSLYSDCFLEPAEEMEEIDSVTSNARLQKDSYNNLEALVTSAYGESQHIFEEDHLQEREKNQKILVEDKPNVKILSARNNKPAFARQGHAFAGAFAGIFVSLCLHPLDTIKTVTQSCRTDHKSVYDVSRSIISQRGVMGLYCGVTSNIVSSAPISAIYTFTYESVKGALLPLFAKEYQSLAHCVAGGCASIATSFVFTPSERIKQQMQIGSHYQSCWNAFVGIIKTGGFSSLYAGWGAVLCRNVPQSIIKFYTYESLKQLMFSSLQSKGQTDTVRTLVCGGLAGSTAAFFTTPFDVVKTRLQTQIPGMNNQFDGVSNTFMAIAKNEGLKGLYRGLTPRLVMYMTQGALFFASYESLKKLFSLETVSLRHSDSALTIHEEPNIKDDSTHLQKAVDVAPKILRT